MTSFYNLLANTLLANVVNNFLWFALTFWVYLETKSVMATAVIGGSFMLFSAFLGLYFGTFVDRNKKKRAMVLSNIITLVGFGAAALLYALLPEAAFLSVSSPWFWLFDGLILAGAVAGNMRLIALSTTVSLLVPANRRDKANGLVGAANGVAFALTSVFSGLAIGLLGMGWALGISVVVTALSLLHLLTITIKEDQPQPEPGAAAPAVDVHGAMRAIKAVPGLWALILFTTFNNFLSGVYMALMDPYGLSLVSVTIWGAIWGFVSVGYIVGGLLVASRGLGPNPLRALFLANIAMWVVSFIFPLRSSVVLLTVGMLVFMALMPIIEAAEQTIIQKVVPFAKQGRVFGFAQSLESAAAPITAFLIGPIAEYWVIPMMTNGAWAPVFTGWFGTGADRGMALIFIAAAIVGLIVTIAAMTTRSYRILAAHYSSHKSPTQPADNPA